MATQLGVYNRALNMIGERKLDSITEARQSRRVIDTVYDQVIDLCLEQGLWWWALRTSSISSTTAAAIDYGFTYTFTRPTDAIHIYTVATTATMQDPLTDFIDDGDNLFANSDPIYVRYTSNDASWGSDLTRWSWAFEKYVSAELASEIAYQITRSTDVENRVTVQAARALLQARRLDSVVSTIGRYPMNFLYRREFHSGAEPGTAWPFPTDEATPTPEA